MAKRTPKYKNHVFTAIKAAKMSIEMFNRVDVGHYQQAALIFNSQAWELLSKAICIKGKQSIIYKNGNSFTAEKSINLIQHKFGKITSEENKTIQQIISLRNEALHNILPEVDQEIITHLMYFSLRCFHKVLKENFKSYFSGFDKNYLSISFKDHTFYSHKATKLMALSKKFSSDKNRLLYLLDRGCKFAEKEENEKMEEYDHWKQKIKKLPRKSRVSRHLSLYDYINSQDDVRFIPVEVSRGYKPEVEVKKSKNPLSPVLIKKSDPNIDFPHLTGEIANKIGKNLNFTAKALNKLGMKENREYCAKIRTNKSGGAVYKYNDKALNFIKNYLETHPDFNPYR